jgi:hypothetical protein
VNYLERTTGSSNAAVLCVHCNYKEADNHSTFKIISSLLRQVIENKTHVSNGVRELYKKHPNRATFGELRTTLVTELKSYAKVFVILDALDEYSENSGSRESLVKVLRGINETAGLLVTSRDIFSIASIFKGAIRSYLRDRIRLSSRRSLKQLEDDVVDTVATNVKGMQVALFRL